MYARTHYYSIMVYSESTCSYIFPDLSVEAMEAKGGLVADTYRTAGPGVDDPEHDESTPA